MTEVVRKGGNSPVRIGASVVVARAQSWQIQDSRNPQREYQLGTVPAIGSNMDAWRYRGTLSVHPIDTQVERALIAEATATNPVTLANLMGMTALSITGPDESLGGALFESVRYTANAPSGVFTANWTFRGTSRGAGATISAPATTGQINFLPKNIMVQFGSLASNLLRVRSIEISAQARNEEAFQFTSGSPWYVDTKEPAVSITIGWWKTRDGTSPGTFAYDLRPAPNEDDPDSLEIQLVPEGGDWDDAGNVQFLLTNVVATGVQNSVSVNSMAEDENTYTADDPTTGGITVQVLS